MGGEVFERPHDGEHQTEHPGREQGALVTRRSITLAPGDEEVPHDQRGHGEDPKQVQVPVEGVVERAQPTPSAVGSPRWLARHDSIDWNA